MKALWERTFPYVGGAIVALIYAIWAPSPDVLSRSLNANTREIFSSMFDLATVLTGLLFAVFLLALVPAGGFLARIFTTQTFAIFRRYVVEALITGTLSTLFSWPLRAMESYPDGSSLLWTSTVTVWSFVSVAAVLSFARVAYIFFVFENEGRRRRGRS